MFKLHTHYYTVQCGMLIKWDCQLLSSATMP